MSSFVLEVWVLLSCVVVCVVGVTRSLLDLCRLFLGEIWLFFFSVLVLYCFFLLEGGFEFGLLLGSLCFEAFEVVVVFCEGGLVLTDLNGIFWGSFFDRFFRSSGSLSFFNDFSCFTFIWRFRYWC